MSNEYEKQGNDFLKKTGVRMTVSFHGHDIYFSGDKESRDIFKIRLQRNRKSYSFKFGQSLNVSTGSGRNKPTAYDILACLTKSDPEDFEWFCSSYGYDTDSQRAERTYEAVLKEWAGVQRLFTPEEIEELAKIN